MADWKKLVSERLDPGASLGPNRENIIRELAAHLEEAYDEARSDGMSESDALRITLQETGDWRVLEKEIRRTRSVEDIMNHRTKSLWLPGMITLLGASVSLMALQMLGYRPNLIWKGHIAVMFYWPWLATLPLFGSAGAYLAQRARARLATRLAVAAFPALLLLIVMCAILPLDMAVDGFLWFRFAYFAVAVVNWVVIPGLALLLGAAPFLRDAPVTAQPQA